MTDLSPALLRFGDVSVRLSVELGRTNMPLRDVLSLGQGSVVALNRLTDELLDITANGKVVAHGEVIAQDGKFALRIVNLVGDDPSAASAAPPMPAATGMAAPTDPVGTGFPEPSPAAVASTPLMHRRLKPRLHRCRQRHRRLPASLSPTLRPRKTRLLGKRTISMIFSIRRLMS